MVEGWRMMVEGWRMMRLGFLELVDRSRRRRHCQKVHTGATGCSDRLIGRLSTSALVLRTLASEHACLHMRSAQEQRRRIFTMHGVERKKLQWRLQLRVGMRGLSNRRRTTTHIPVKVGFTVDETNYDRLFRDLSCLT